MNKESNQDMTFDERMSASLDNQASGSEIREVLDSVEENQEMEAAWERHNTINALLRGEQLSTRRAPRFEHIRADLPALENEVKSDLKSRFADFLRSTSTIGWTGGVAMAMSVLLVVSLFVVVVDNGVFESQNQLASEPQIRLPNMADITPADALGSSPSSNFEQVAAKGSEGDVAVPASADTETLLASDDETILPTEDSATARRVPVTQPQTKSSRNDLVRFASDRK